MWKKIDIIVNSQIEKSYIYFQRLMMLLQSIYLQLLISSFIQTIYSFNIGQYDVLQCRVSAALCCSGLHARVET